MIFLYLFFFFFFFKELKFQANAVHNHLNLLDCTIVKLEVGNLQLSREFPQDFRYYFNQVHRYMYIRYYQQTTHVHSEI